MFSSKLLNQYTQPKFYRQFLTPHYYLLFALLAIAFFVRVYRTHDLLRFYYDQGRDALVITDMISSLKPVLVGPTTGLAGILRGPAFYYLLLPAYLVGRGSPVVAAIWLQLINLFGLIFVYLSAKKLFNQNAGLIAVFIMGFSHRLVDLSRWLSNPSPILTSVPLMLYGLLQIKDGKRPHLWWPVVALMLGLNLQFEIASEFWFIPAVLILLFIFPSMRPTKKTGLISLGIFFATLLPQIIFDFRHQHIMFNAIKNHFSNSNTQSFAFTIDLVQQRLHFYIDVFSETLIPRRYAFSIILLIFALPLLLYKKYYSSLKLLLTLLLVPLFILLFYQGNEGNFYSYYLIGLFPLFLVLVAGAFSTFTHDRILTSLVLLTLLLFFQHNYILNKNFLIAGVDGPEHITLGNQLQAIDWIYQNAGDTPFNIDVYVPPVIPYAYDHLFTWHAHKHSYTPPQDELTNTLYTLYEIDTQHPQFLADWLTRQAGIGEIKDSASFGGVHVQKRTRL